MVKVSKEMAIHYATLNSDEGYNCAEATFRGLVHAMGKQEKYLTPLCTCFGGGMGRSELICGAVSGGLMAIGMAVNRTSPQEKEKKEIAYKLSQDFIKEFKEQKGSLYCTDLCECNLSSTEGLQEFNDKNLHSKVCRGLVEFSAEITSKAIEKI